MAENIKTKMLRALQQARQVAHQAECAEYASRSAHDNARLMVLQLEEIFNEMREKGSEPDTRTGDDK